MSYDLVLGTFHNLAILTSRGDPHVKLLNIFFFSKILE